MSIEKQPPVEYQISYDLWFGKLLNELPQDPNQLKDFCKNQEVPFGNRSVKFTYPDKAAELLNDGYIPTPGEYDLVNIGSVANWLLDTWSQNHSGETQPKSRKQRETEEWLNEQFGQGNWKLIDLDTIKPGESAIASPTIMIPFVKKRIAVEKYDLMAKFRRYPNILAKLE